MRVECHQDSPTTKRNYARPCSPEEFMEELEYKKDMTSISWTRGLVSTVSSFLQLPSFTSMSCPYTSLYSHTNQRSGSRFCTTTGVWTPVSTGYNKKV